jgi:hypothetical protein
MAYLLVPPADEQSSAHVLSHLCAFWQSAVQKMSEHEKKRMKSTRKQQIDEPQKSSSQLSTPAVTLDSQAISQNPHLQTHAGA